METVTVFINERLELHADGQVINVAVSDVLEMIQENQQLKRKLIEVFDATDGMGVRWGAGWRSRIVGWRNREAVS